MAPPKKAKKAGKEKDEAPSLDSFDKSFSKFLVPLESIRRKQSDLLSTGSLHVDGLIRGGLVRGTMSEFYGPPKSGKCLGRDTPVMMFDGTIRPVQEVRVGDLLMGPDSKPRAVLGTTSGRGPLYRVIPNKGESYVVNDKHVLSLKMSMGATWHKKGAIVNISIDEYLTSTNTFKHYAKGWRTGVDFPAKEVSLDPYILGVWLGDGISDNTCITNPDTEVLEAVAAYAASEGINSHITYNSAGCETVAVRTPRQGGAPNPMREKLRQYKVFGAGNKHIPHQYLINSRAVRLQVLAGILDTDGYHDRRVFEIVSKYETLANDIAFLARSLGLAAYVVKCQKSCPTRKGTFTGTYFKVSISGHTDEIPTKVLRKRAGPRVRNFDVLHTGIMVEPIGEGEYFGFELDGDHLFLLGDFTVTHNSSLAMSTAAQVLKNGGLVAYFDLERGLDAGLDLTNEQFVQGWLQTNGVEPTNPNFRIYRPTYGEEMYEMLEEALVGGFFDYVVIDSMAAIVTKAEMEGNIGESSYGKVANLNSQALRRLMIRFNENIGKTHITVINQVRANIGGHGFSSTGGYALPHYVACKLKIQRIGGSQHDSKETFTESRVDTEKSRYSKSGRVIININSDFGIDLLQELLDWGTKNGYVHCPSGSSWYSFLDSRTGEELYKVQGAKKAKVYIRESGLESKLYELAKADIFNNNDDQ